MQTRGSGNAVSCDSGQSFADPVVTGENKKALDHRVRGHVPFWASWFEPWGSVDLEVVLELFRFQGLGFRGLGFRV